MAHPQLVLILVLLKASVRVIVLLIPSEYSPPLLVTAILGSIYLNCIYNKPISMIIYNN